MPVKVEGKYYQSIRDAGIDVSDWAMDHWKTLEINYYHAGYFDEIAEWLEPLYITAGSITHLSLLNRRFIEAIFS